MSITAAKVGPFDLGTVVIHFPLDINPETADVTIPAGAGGADQIPHIIKGIVIHVRDIRVYIGRQRLHPQPDQLRPELKLSATVIGAGAAPTPQGAVTVADQFQAADCSEPQFKPKFSASTAAKTASTSGRRLV